jgi:hypothetical protein
MNSLNIFFVLLQHTILYGALYYIYKKKLYILLKEAFKNIYNTLDDLQSNISIIQSDIDKKNYELNLLDQKNIDHIQKINSIKKYTIDERKENEKELIEKKIAEQNKYIDIIKYQKRKKRYLNTLNKINSLFKKKA